MISAEFLTFLMEWFSKNNLGIILFVVALVPVLAIAVVAYMVHVLALAISQRKK